MTTQAHRPTAAFIGASWAALIIGAATYLVGLWNANLELNEKGFYFTLLLYGLFSAVSMQKTVRDKLEGIPVTSIYFGICAISLALSILLLTVGLWNASLASSEKGFYSMAFLLSLFGAVATQKNVRDLAQFSTRSKSNKIQTEKKPASPSTVPSENELNKTQAQNPRHTATN